MSIENTIESIDQSLKQIVTILAAQAATATAAVNLLTTQTPAAEAPATEKKPRGRPAKADEKNELPAATAPQTATTAPTATAPVEAASAPTSTTATPPAAPAQAPAAPAADVTWKEVLTAIQALNKSDKPGHGRDGVLAVLKKFGKDGDKVPALEALGKHADILAFVNGLINPATDADDLGI